LHNALERQSTNCCTQVHRCGDHHTGEITVDKHRTCGNRCGQRHSHGQHAFFVESRATTDRRCNGITNE